MKERRTRPGFLSDGEAARDKKRTEDFVRSITENQQSKPFSQESRLCDSCGSEVQVDKWRCQKCNINFCDECGKDFGRIHKKVFPDCPVCGVRLYPEGNVKLQSDMQAVLRYIESTNFKNQGDDEMCQRIARIFQKDIIYVRQIWSTIKREHPILLAQLRIGIVAQHNSQTSRDSGRSVVGSNEKRPDTLRPNSIFNPQRVAKPEKIAEKEELEIKDLKPLNGFESEWKDGKMKPPDQKNYRGTFQDKE